MYQLYYLEPKKNGELILRYALSRPTLSAITEIASKWAANGKEVICIPAPTIEKGDINA